MFAYVDESGNTGNELFDPQQPVFITAAMMTKTNFDAVRKNDLRSIACRVEANALHANELGVRRIEEIASYLLHIIKKADAKFFVSRVEKRYLAAAKVVDTYFDAGENLAVPWHMYWVRPLRLTLMFKLATYVIDKEIAQIAWDCVTAKSDAKSKVFLLKVLKKFFPALVPCLTRGRVKSFAMLCNGR